MFPQVTFAHWVAFCAGVVVLLALDLFVFHRRDHEPTVREAAGWSVFWIVLALTFNGLIWWWAGREYALQFLSGYVIEKSLSMDNVFVFAAIFSYFAVPLKYQYRVLYWGILGAIVMRLTFVLVASQVIQRFEWVLYLFGAFLVYAGVKLSLAHGVDPQPERNFVMRLARRLFPLAQESHGHRFFAREMGRFCVTPLFFVLLIVESTDVVFAVDSVPAVFAVTRVPFLVFTSNVFAILGLRALYFLLASVMHKFAYLYYGLSAVLVFVGAKMLVAGWVHIDSMVSLAVIVSLLATSILASLVVARGKEEPVAEVAIAPLDPEPTAADSAEPTRLLE